jgi:hypothetical protein
MKRKNKEDRKSGRRIWARECGELEKMRRIGESGGFAVTVMEMGIARNVMFARRQSSEDIVRKTQTVVTEAERILNETNKRKAKNEFCWIAKERNV